jgi:surface carbohydrate biosynthesis protein (TIGR04326 family)
MSLSELTVLPDNGKGMAILDLTKLSVPQVKKLNDISIVIKSDFNDFIGAIYKSMPASPIEYLLSSAASRNSFLSGLFLNICYLEFVVRSLEENPEICVIRVSSRALKKILEDHVEKKEIKVRIVRDRKRAALIKEKLGIARSLLVRLLYYFQLWRFQSAERVRQIPHDRELSLIDVFILDGFLNEDGKFNDRYYPGLWENLPDDVRRNVMYLPHFLTYRKIRQYLRRAAKADVPFLIKSDFLKFRDYWEAFIFPRKIKRLLFGPNLFKSFDVSPLLAEDRRKNRWDGSILEAFLNHRFVQRLHEEGIKIKIVIDWFENQLIDRGLQLALKKYYPGAYAKGYQGFLVSFDYNFYLQPTDYEVKAGVIPNEICVIGRGLISAVKRYDQDLIVSVAPAFRFQHVWDDDESVLLDKENRSILVVLPFTFKESKDILDLIGDALSRSKLSGYDFLIKPHPALPLRKLTSKMKHPWPANFKAASGDFRACLRQVSLLIGNTSSTCVEALAKGLPVIIIGSQRELTQNPIPKDVSREIWRLCYTVDELAEAVEHFMTLPDPIRNKLKEIGSSIREAFFERVTAENTRKFISIPEHAVGERTQRCP